MARITVEDCIPIVPNRFELVAIAAVRSRELSAGAEPAVDVDRDKPEVVALREIATRGLDVDAARERLVRLVRHEAAEDGAPAGDEPLDQQVDELDIEAFLAAAAADGQGTASTETGEDREPADDGPGNPGGQAAKAH